MVTSLLLLAGGDGTRLKHITNGVSKPLVKIGKEEVITIVLRKLIKDLNISKIYLLIQEKHITQYVDYLNSQLEMKRKIELIVEKTKLGTGGAIKAFLNKNNLHNFYVSNADTIIRSDISGFKKAAVNTILCTRSGHSLRFGSLKVDANYNIISFIEKKSVKDAIISTGVYKLNRDVFLDIEEQIFDLERVVFPRLASKKLLKSFLSEIEFEDIGTPEAFFKEIERTKRTN